VYKQHNRKLATGAKLSKPGKLRAEEVEPWGEAAKDNDGSALDLLGAWDGLLERQGMGRDGAAEGWRGRARGVLSTRRSRGRK